MRRFRSGVVALVLVAATIGCAPVIVPAGPPVAPPRLSADGIVAADGMVLPMRRWLPESGEPRAVIMALHGFNDYSNFFDDAGKWLAERGVVSYAYDQRGFGRTERRGLWPGMETLAQDASAAAALLRERHPGLPFYVLGESMGGAVSMVAMTGPAPPAVDGLILSAPAVWGRSSMPFYQRWLLAVAARTVPWMTVTGRGLKVRPSDNIEMLRALGRDPLVIKETRIDAIHGLTDLMDKALESSPALPPPALILYGLRDEVIPAAPTSAMIATLSGQARSRIRVAVYDAGWHMLLRDLQAETVWRDIAAWTGDPNTPLPSGADIRTLPATATR